MIQEKIREARLLVHRSNNLLEDLELGRGGSDLQTKVDDVANQLATKLGELKEMADQETSGKRELMKRQVMALCEEHTDVRKGIDRFITTAHRRNVASRRRNELMEGANYSEDRSAQQHLTAEGEGIASVQRSLDSIVGEGDAVLQALQGHTTVLQSTQQKLYSYLESMQLSGSILTTIQRTTRTDSIILYGGMAIVTLMLLIIYWYK